MCYPPVGVSRPPETYDINLSGKLKSVYRMMKAAFEWNDWPAPSPQKFHHFTLARLALSVVHFMETATFLSRVQGYVRQSKSSELAPGFDEDLVTGDPDWRMVRKSLRDGVRLEPATWEMLERFSAELEVPCPERL